MFKIGLMILFLQWIVYAHTLPELFQALKHHSQTEVDDLLIQQAKASENMAVSQLYPKINIFAKYDHYTTPTGIVPVPPNNLLSMVKDTSVAQPFSQDILREGISFNMPLFIKSIFTMAKKAKIMEESLNLKRNINLLKNEALIVVSNENLLALEAFQKSLDLKEASLLETKKTLQMKVNNGRAPASALYKLNDGLNQIKIAKNNTMLQKSKITSVIYALTGIYLTSAIDMNLTKGVTKKVFLASLEPLRKKLLADKLETKMQKEKFYPTVSIHGSYSVAQAKAYNNDNHVNEEYGNIGVVVNIPIVNMSMYSQLDLSKVKLKVSKKTFQKMKDELQAQVKMLEDSLGIVNNSIVLYKQNIEDKKQLLKIAKLNYKNTRISTEEYLRYEDDVVFAKAQLYKAKANIVQITMQLAVIYANNIEEIVQ